MGEDSIDYKKNLQIMCFIISNYSKLNKSHKSTKEYIDYIRELFNSFNNKKK